MISDLRTAFHRSRETLLGDMIGGAALMVALVGALYLPGLF